jgi:hypothetical protein
MGRAGSPGASRRGFLPARTAITSGSILSVIAGAVDILDDVKRRFSPLQGRDWRERLDG